MNRHGGGVSIDPVCGKLVVEQGAAASVEYERKTYYFCSGHCRSLFDREPERIRVGEIARAGALFGQGRARWGIA
jgi:YHS domain-containing protein